MASTPLCLSFASVLDNVREPPADLGKSNDALCCLCRIQNSEFGPVEPAPNSFESLFAKQFSSNHLGFSIIPKYVTIGMCKIIANARRQGREAFYVDR